MSELQQQIAGNVTRVREQIDAAARRSGRDPRSIRLVAVTKYVGLNEVLALLDARCFELGESRPQELWKKVDAISHPHVQWHMIGHLQRNKVRRTLPAVRLVHSCDSLRLLQTIDTEAGRDAHVIPVLLEVNVAGDTAKHGFSPDELASLLPTIADLRHIKVHGLMGMAARGSDRVTARPYFVRLRELRDRLSGIGVPGIQMEELSMGMSGDFETAIEEGATIVRVGKTLFSGGP
ncbi:MAG: YggS family pyridoxal phosphate-dependent enzyme [Planctomycetaceae bacterium]|nr:YggS family pyridoxal phosphate-dependent enzyme [Planctomycetaceae bacterium]